MRLDMVFLPEPRQIFKKPGNFSFKPGIFIQIQGNHPQHVLFSAEQIKSAIETHTYTSCQITTSQSVPEERITIRIKVDPDVACHPQAYRLSITQEMILITGSDEAGVFYGVQTLKQIITQSTDQPLPCLEIEDWPDFPVRGVMLDISRDKVYRMATLMMLVDELSSWKINQLQLYTEHTFAYIGHEIVWQAASPITPEEILTLDRYCLERHIELVPNQNSFGHMSRWLIHPPYQHLAETMEPVPTPWGGIQNDPFSLSPVSPESLAFVKTLYDQLLPNFSSKMVNVGCDETFDIGMGQSKQAVKKIGKGQVYLDFLLSLYREVRQRGYSMQYWGDIVLEHPELIPNLPRDAIALNWGYEADHPFAEETRAFQQAGIPFYVCPGTSSWNSIAGRTDNMLNNIRNAAIFGLNHGACGFLNTDWGDNGHWQQLPISYPGLAAGAAWGWCGESNQAMDPAKTLNQLVFYDDSGLIGDLLLDIGNLYKAWGLILPNSSPLFWLLQESKPQLTHFDIDDPAPINASLADLSMKIKNLSEAKIRRPDSELILTETALTIRLLQLACKRALGIFDPDFTIDNNLLLREISDIKVDFSNCWLHRNRPGGLADSLARFNILVEEYQTQNG